MFSTIASLEGKQEMEETLRFIKLVTRMWNILSIKLIDIAKC